LTNSYRRRHIASQSWPSQRLCMLARVTLSLAACRIITCTAFPYRAGEESAFFCRRISGLFILEKRYAIRLACLGARSRGNGCYSMISHRSDLTEPLETLLRLVTEHEAYFQQHEVRIAELEHAISSVKHPDRSAPQVWT
jgi:hypothetical protein